MTADTANDHPVDARQNSSSHRRLNLLNGEWVLVSPHRARRPWQGQQESAESSPTASHDPHCHLCAGNTRANGVRNPPYRGAFVFDNDFPALTPRRAANLTGGDDPLLHAMPAAGTCRVICYSPHHAHTFTDLPAPAIRRIVDAWCTQTEEPAKSHAWVQVFENKGAAMGCSSPHPHGQVWATDYLPAEAEREDRLQRGWYARSGRPLLVDYADREAKEGTREVLRSVYWLVVVPYWASWPFETRLLPRSDVRRLPDLTHAQRDDLARILKCLSATYDRLFDCPFPYSMGWHGAPSQGAPDGHWTLHAHFYPPLLRSATVRKHMVGFELLAELQRDLTPEMAAAELRRVSV